MKYEEKIKGAGILSFGIAYYFVAVFFLIQDFAFAKLIWFITPSIFVGVGYDILKKDYKKDSIRKENLDCFEVIQKNLNLLKQEKFNKLLALEDRPYNFSDFVSGKSTDFLVRAQKNDEDTVDVFINKKFLNDTNDTDIYYWKFLSFRKNSKELITHDLYNIKNHCPLCDEITLFNIEAIAFNKKEYQQCFQCKNYFTKIPSAFSFIGFLMLFACGLFLLAASLAGIIMIFQIIKGEFNWPLFIVGLILVFVPSFYNYKIFRLFYFNFRFKPIISSSISLHDDD